MARDEKHWIGHFEDGTVLGNETEPSCDCGRKQLAWVQWREEVTEVTELRD